MLMVCHQQESLSFDLDLKNFVGGGKMGRMALFLLNLCFVVLVEVHTLKSLLARTLLLGIPSE